MTSEHIVTAFDKELEQLNNTLIEMGGIAEAQISAAVAAVVKRDPSMAEKIVRDDDKVDDLNLEVDNTTTRLLALRQPMGADLRNVVAAIKIASDLERIADYAANIAKRAVPLSQAMPVKPVHVIPRMARLAQHMIKDVLDAFLQRDAEKAYIVWLADDEVDEMYTSLFRELLTYMIEDPRSITPCTHLLFIAKNIERIGDHVTNIAETIWFLVHGKRLAESRQREGRPEFEFSTPSLEEPPAPTRK
jgi:phosphate transport system protein